MGPFTIKLLNWAIATANIMHIPQSNVEMIVLLTSSTMKIKMHINFKQLQQNKALIQSFSFFCCSTTAYDAVRWEYFWSLTNEQYIYSTERSIYADCLALKTHITADISTAMLLSSCTVSFVIMQVT